MSDSTRDKVQKSRAAGEILSDIAKAVEAGKVPQFAELLTKIADKVGMDEIAEAFAEAIKGENPAARRKFALDYANLLKQFQQMTGEITVDEIGRMSQMQLDSFIDEKLEKLNDKRRAREAGAKEAGSGAASTPKPHDHQPEEHKDQG